MDRYPTLNALSSASNNRMKANFVIFIFIWVSFIVLGVIFDTIINKVHPTLNFSCQLTTRVFVRLALYYNVLLVKNICLWQCPDFVLRIKLLFSTYQAPLFLFLLATWPLSRNSTFDPKTAGFVCFCEACWWSLGFYVFFYDPSSLVHITYLHVLLRNDLWNGN